MPANDTKLTAERARFLFNYNPQTGDLKWKNPTARAVKVGDLPGRVSPQGYRYVSIDHKLFLAHRIVWLMVHGELPDEHLVAKNGNYDDLRIENFAVRQPTKRRDAAQKEVWRLDQRLRGLWSRTLRDNSDITGWKTFAEFSRDLKELVFPQAHLVKIDAAKPIGPGNFEIKPRAKFDRSTLEGRVTYYRDRSQTDRVRYHHHHIKSTFGVTLDQYREMLTAQNGVCATCKQPETAVRNGRVMQLSIDHHHETGAVRGLLCKGCNNGIGWFRESPAAMRAAADYIEHHAKKQKSAPASNVITLKTKER